MFTVVERHFMLSETIFKCCFTWSKITILFMCCLIPSILLTTLNHEITVDATSWSPFNVLIIISVFLPLARSLSLKFFLWGSLDYNCQSLQMLTIPSWSLHGWLELGQRTYWWFSMPCFLTLISRPYLQSWFLQCHYHHLYYCQLLHHFSIWVHVMQSSWIHHYTNFKISPFLGSLGEIFYWYWEVP